MDGRVELFTALQMSDNTEDHLPAENAHDGLASQSSMDCSSVGEGSESVITKNSSCTAQTRGSNGQTSKGPSSPGPQPVKTTCVVEQAANPKLNLCLSDSPRKVISPPSEVDMPSPDGSVCKTVLINNSVDKCDDGSVCAETQAKESQQLIKHCDSGSSAKERVHLVSMVTEDTERVECSGSSNMSQDFIESHSDAIFKRYF